jgi:hypothetical protein
VRTADPLKGPFLGVLQAIRRLLTRPECFRLEREFAGPVFHRGGWRTLDKAHRITAPSGSSRPAVVQRKVTNGYRAMWAAEGEAAIRTVVDTARLTGGSPFSTVLKTIGA